MNKLKSLGEKNAPQQILFQNMGDNFPSKIAREIGYGENTELDSIGTTADLRSNPRSTWME